MSQLLGKGGLTGDRADDAVQATIATFFEGYRSGGYEKDKGRLRSYPKGIAKNKFHEAVRGRAKSPVQPHESDSSAGLVNRIPAPDNLENIFDDEWEQQVRKTCLLRVPEEVGEKTFEAFWLYAMEGWPAERVAEHLGMRRNAVYIDKHRVLSRLRELVEEYE